MPTVLVLALWLLVRRSGRGARGREGRGDVLTSSSAEAAPGGEGAGPPIRRRRCRSPALPIWPTPISISKGKVPDMKRNRALFDAVVLVVYLVAANPALTGVPCTSSSGWGPSSSWAFTLLPAAMGLAGRGRAGRLALNIVLLVALAACVVSGVMVSGAALPSLGLYATATPSGIRCTPWRPRCCSRPSSCTWSCAPPPPWRCCGNAGVVAPREAIARWTN